MPTERPFKRFFCDRRDTLKMPHVAFKIWMYHYVCEQDQGPTPRQSWPSVPEIMRSCGIKKRDTVFEWRSWLVDNGWLTKLGERPSRQGSYAVPIYRVTRGYIPDPSRLAGQSREKGLDPSRLGGLDPSRLGGQEVEPFEVEPIQVDQSRLGGRVKILLNTTHLTGHQSETSGAAKTASYLEILRRNRQNDDEA